MLILDKKMVKIAFFEIEPWEEEYIRKNLRGHSLKFFREHLDEKSINKVKDFDVIAIFIYSKINAKLLAKLKRVKLITTMSTGFEHVDLNSCKKKKITVCNVPSYGENTVAEHTFGLILTISKKLFDSIERTRKGDFRLEGLRGFDLKGKTLGILGTGKIGSHVARIAKGFEMEVIAYDVFPNKNLAKDFGFRYVLFNDVLKKSDVITLHTPLTRQTRHMINKKNIGLIKKGAVLINTARGELVETPALLEALNKGIISYAGLDVLEDECSIREEKELLSTHFKKKCDLKTLLAEHVLLQQKNVYITPHNAFNSTEALQRIMDVTIENIKYFLKGNAKNRVNS